MNENDKMRQLLTLDVELNQFIENSMWIIG